MEKNDDDLYTSLFDMSTVAKKPGSHIRMVQQIVINRKPVLKGSTIQFEEEALITYTEENVRASKQDKKLKISINRGCKRIDRERGNRPLMPSLTYQHRDREYSEPLRNRSKDSKLEMQQILSATMGQRIINQSKMLRFSESVPLISESVASKVSMASTSGEMEDLPCDPLSLVNVSQGCTNVNVNANVNANVLADDKCRTDESQNSQQCRNEGGKDCLSTLLPLTGLSYRYPLGQYKFNIDKVQFSQLEWSSIHQDLQRKYHIRRLAKLISDTYCIIDVYGEGIHGRLFSEDGDSGTEGFYGSISNSGEERALILEALSLWNSEKYSISLTANAIKDLIVKCGNEVDEDEAKNEFWKLLRPGNRDLLIDFLIQRLYFRYQIDYEVDDSSNDAPTTESSSDIHEDTTKDVVVDNCNDKNKPVKSLVVDDLESIEGRLPPGYPDSIQEILRAIVSHPKARMMQKEVIYEERKVTEEENHQQASDDKNCQMNHCSDMNLASNTTLPVVSADIVSPISTSVLACASISAAEIDASAANSSESSNGSSTRVDVFVPALHQHFQIGIQVRENARLKRMQQLQAKRDQLEREAEAKRQAWLATPLRLRGLQFCALHKHAGRYFSFSCYLYPLRPTNIKIQSMEAISCHSLPHNLGISVLAGIVKAKLSTKKWPKEMLRDYLRQMTERLKLIVNQVESEDKNNTNESKEAVFEGHLTIGDTFGPLCPVSPLKSVYSNGNFGYLSPGYELPMLRSPTPVVISSQLSWEFCWNLDASFVNQSILPYHLHTVPVMARHLNQPYELNHHLNGSYRWSQPASSMMDIANGNQRMCRFVTSWASSFYCRRAIISCFLHSGWNSRSKPPEWVDLQNQEAYNYSYASTSKPVIAQPDSWMGEDDNIDRDYSNNTNNNSSSRHDRDDFKNQADELHLNFMENFHDENDVEKIDNTNSNNNEGSSRNRDLTQNLSTSNKEVTNVDDRSNEENENDHGDDQSVGNSLGDESMPTLETNANDMKAELYSTLGEEILLRIVIDNVASGCLWTFDNVSKHQLFAMMPPKLDDYLYWALVATYSQFYVPSTDLSSSSKIICTQVGWEKILRVLLKKSLWSFVDPSLDLSADEIRAGESLGRFRNVGKNAYLHSSKATTSLMKTYPDQKKNYNPMDKDEDDDSHSKKAASLLHSLPVLRISSMLFRKNMKIATLCQEEGGSFDYTLLHVLVWQKDLILGISALDPIKGNVYDCLPSKIVQHSQIEAVRFMSQAERFMYLEMFLSAQLQLHYSSFATLEKQMDGKLVLIVEGENESEDENNQSNMENIGDSKDDQNDTDFAFEVDENDLF